MHLKIAYGKGNISMEEKIQESVSVPIKGRVKWFSRLHGYGMIISEKGKRFFCHYSQIQMEGHRTLNAGDIVSFEKGERPDGKKQAINVVPVLTLKMVRREARKCHCKLKPVGDSEKTLLWKVVDQNGVVQSDEKGMTLEETSDWFGMNWDEQIAL